MENKIARNTLFLYFRLVFLMFISFYTSRKLLELLGVDDFGIYNVVGSIVAIFGSIKGLMTSSTQRYLNFEMGRGHLENVSKVFSMSVIIHVLLGILFFVIVEFFGLWYIKNKLVINPERLSAAYYVFHFSLLTVIISILTVPYDALIISHEKMKVYAYISILDGVLKLLMIFVLLNVELDSLIQYSFSIFVISFIIRLISSIYCRRAFKVIRFNYCWDKLLFKDMLTFSGWQFFGNTSFAIQSQGLNIILNLFYGPGLNAVRGLSLQVSSAIQTFTQNILIASNPQIVKLFAKGEKRMFISLILKVSKYSFYMILLLTIPFFLFAKDLLILWLKNVPKSLDIFLQITLIYSLIRVFHNPLDSAIKATGKIRTYQVLDASCLLLSLPLSYLFLVLGYPPEFTIFAMIIVEVFNLLIIVFYSKKIIELPVVKYFKNVILPAFSVLLMLLLFFMIKEYFKIDSWIVINKMLFLCFVYIISVSGIWFFGIDNDDKVIVKIKFLKKIGKNEKN